MKSVLISIRPKWVEKIASGEKTIEVRKSAPKELPFKAYIYCTRIIDKKHCRDEFDIGIWKGNEHIIGEFICDKVDEYNFHEGLTEFNSMGLPSRIYGSYLIFADEYKSMCLSYDEVKNYGKGKTLYGWHISNLKIYDKPKQLNEFFTIADECNCCYGCMWNATPLEEMPCRICMSERKYLYRPPQSWQYVEELEK